METKTTMMCGGISNETRAADKHVQDLVDQVKKDRNIRIIQSVAAIT